MTLCSQIQHASPWAKLHFTVEPYICIIYIWQ